MKTTLILLAALSLSQLTACAALPAAAIFGGDLVKNNMRAMSQEDEMREFNERTQKCIAAQQESPAESSPFCF